ncbi:hypothetical protein [Diplocloster modestus]|uniref:Uncharacterized protein n=1 Tax=Diplocloster modestus TaxID=2850322 RepID=A0ABS6KEC6_9FIRM|nr:hypothetical protein [Diplocloster modestus]MBU9728868.1 hypothetical protein [Diplocloster modestus]
MKVCDIVHFSNERCFNGAVQTEWFYDQERVEAVAESYVFHGPKYFGVSEVDVDLNGHKLVDTASFALNLAMKLYKTKPNNNFIMTIAGYGAGKSHLAVSLAGLFSGDKDLSDLVLNKIRIADKNIAEKICQVNTKKNLVIVLNGMNNFNLDSEILKCVRVTLSQNGMTDEVLRSLTKSYDIARQFVEKAFSKNQSQFESYAAESGLNFKGDDLRGYLMSNIESDNRTITVVNTMYKEITGDSIRWDRGLSAGDILTEVCTKLCGENKPFNKILILFDEFGRFIEYAATNPDVAGEAALQQIFEAVQSADGKIIFSGFVQNELEAYLSRVGKTSNVIRYVGRYKASEALYLSSNFETILANLLQKTSEVVYSRAIGNALNKYGNYYDKIESALIRWDRSKRKRDVWVNRELYKTVILQGCYPLHPITVWLLSDMHSWMQQRSAISFAAEMVERISQVEIEGTWLPYIYPIDIIDSGIYKEMLSSEEKGLVQSQYCMLYQDIIVKVGDKLGENERKALKSILVVNIGHFVLLSRDEVMLALRYCSDLKENELITALKRLENMYGIIAYDENTNKFDMLAEANGIYEFKRIYARYKMMAKPASIEDCEDALKKRLELNLDIETAFAQQHHISSTEWKFKKKLMDSADITDTLLMHELRELDMDYSGEGYRGEVIFAYCSKDSDREIIRLSELHKHLGISNYPLLITFLDDHVGKIVSGLTLKNVLNRFSTADAERFQKHITLQHKSVDEDIVNTFKSLVRDRLFIVDEGLRQYQMRLSPLCTSKFEEIYYQAPAFMFDGFENKSPVAARRYLANICTKMFDRTLMNIQSYNALSTDEKNRIKACLAVNGTTSWQVFDNTCTFIKPNNTQMLHIFNLVEETLKDDEALSVTQLFGRFTKAPYGMNVNAIALFTFYFIAYQDKNIRCYFGSERLQPAHLSSNIFKNLKLQPKEFLKIRLQKNKQVNVDPIQELCKEIMGCTLVEDCQNYKKKLEDLLAQEGDSQSDKVIIASASTRLDEGIKLRAEIYDKLNKGQDILDSVKKSFRIYQFVNVFECYVDTNIPISNSLPFTYSDNYKEKMEKLKNEANELLNKKGIVAINKLTCDITQLSQFKERSRRTAQKFRNQGYEKYACAIESRALELEEELLAKNKYEATFVELYKDIAMISDASAMGYSTCSTALEKMKGWERFFLNITDMPETLLKEHEAKVKNAITILTKRLDDISFSFRDVLNKVSLIQSLPELIQYRDKLSAILELGLKEEDVSSVNETLNQIAAAKSIIEKMPENIDDLKNYQKTLHADDLGKCNLAVTTELDMKLADLVKQQTDWISRYILPIENSIDSMSAIDCSNWLDRTQELPVYLDASSLNRYNDVSFKVEAQLHKSRVQGVFILFHKLNDEEKVEFLKMISADK